MPSQVTLNTGLTVARPQQGSSKVMLPEKSIVYSMMNVPIGVGMYNYIVGTSAQVTANIASHSDLSTVLGLATDGTTILILSGYTYTGNVTVSKQVTIHGQGRKSIIDGNIIFASGSSYSIANQLKVIGNVTFNSGANGIFFRENFVLSSSVVTDSGTANSKLYIIE